MAYDAEMLVERRRLKRRAFFWRTIAFVAVAAALAGGYAARNGTDGLFGERDHIARLSISGFIGTDKKYTDAIEKLKKDKHVKGVIVALETPGGSTSGGEAIYEALRDLSKEKPTVARIDALAASAGYMIALGTDQIVARRNALTGSIGVIIQWPDASKLLDTVGVKYEEVKSSPMKAEPTPFKPVSPEARAMLDKAIRDSYEWFVSVVAERRGFDSATAHELADGRVVTGAMAKDLKLVDQIGGESVAIEWLATKGVDRKLKVVDVSLKPFGSWTGISGEDAVATMVRGALKGVSGGLAGEGDAKLDGMTSVWHP
jgi:protease-4